MGRGQQAVPHHRAEDEGAQLLPLLAEVVRVDLSEEDGQDHGQNGHQVHLPPVLQRREVAYSYINTSEQTKIKDQKKHQHKHLSKHESPHKDRSTNVF